MEKQEYNFNSDFFWINYRPSRGDLILCDELKFVYSLYNWTKPIVFFTDIEPYQDEYLCEILNLQFNGDYSEISFEVIYDERGEAEERVLKATGASHFKCNKMMYKLVDKVNNQGGVIDINKDNLDDIKIIFEKDKFESLELYRNDKAHHLTDSLLIQYKDGHLLYTRTYIKEYGIENIKEKLILKGLSVSDFKINYSYEGGVGSFELDINADVYKIIEELMNIEGVLDFSIPTEN